MEDCALKMTVFRALEIVAVSLYTEIIVLKVPVLPSMYQVSRCAPALTNLISFKQAVDMWTLLGVPQCIPPLLQRRNGEVVSTHEGRLSNPDSCT